MVIVFSRAMSPMRPCPFQPSPRSIGHHATCRTSWLRLEGLTRLLRLLSSWYCKPTSNDRCTCAVSSHLSPRCLTRVNDICHWFKSALTRRRFIYCNGYLARQPIILRRVCWSYLVQVGCKCMHANNFFLASGVGGFTVEAVSHPIKSS